MHRTTIIAFCLILGMAASGSASAEPDARGSKDHPLLTRMNGFHITGYTEKDFDTYKFLDKNGKAFPVEGRYFHLQYNLDKGVKEPGELKIRRNIQNALKDIGGKIVFDDNFNKLSTLVLKKDNRETWVMVRSYPAMYRLWIVEKAAMEQEVVANADSMSKDIHATGHVAVYGIYFDTGLSVLKPESDAAIAEIAKLLTTDAGLKLDVVGHTDNVGAFDSNMKLSRERADAVARTLTGKHRIAATRLRANGVASLCPVMSNDTEEGRARNRRVELVKQ